MQLTVSLPVRAMALALAVAALSGAAIAKGPGQTVLTPSSQTALVIIKTDWWRPAASMKSAFKLSLSAFDPAEEKLLGGPYSGGGLFEARQKDYIEGYLIEAIKPGRYVFLSYSQQDKWALCFNAGSQQFEVKPGEVIYLGVLDALTQRDQLKQQAVSTGQVSIRGSGFVDFFDLPAGPQLAPIDDGQVEEVRDMLARRLPQVTAPVRGAEYSPAVFGTGSTLFGQRRCGGYFAKGPKGADTEN